MSETGRFLDAALAGEKILGLTTTHAATPGVKLAVAFRQLSAALEIDNFQTAFVWVCRLRVFITSSSSRIKVLRYRGVTQWRATTTQKERKKKELDDVGWQSDDSHETRRSLSAACKALRVFFLPSSGVGGRYVALKHKWWRPLHDGLIHQRLRSRMVGACRWVFYHWWDKVDLFEYRKVEKIVFENKVCLTCNIWHLYSLPKLFKSDFMDNDDEGQLIVRIWQSTGNPWILVSMKINVYREITWNR